MQLTKRQMKPEEFVFVMDQNKDAYPEWATLSEERKRFIAEGNLVYGVAETYLDPEGNIVGVSGVRYVGIGEAWLITLPDARRPSLLRTVKKLFANVMKENNLWRVFAETRFSQGFLTHLGFKKYEGTYVWERQWP
jgi:N-acetylglutamate synthase-like GNAT family acetyltransferase